jgi:RND family efflux transporter MFP subunit
MNKHNLKSVLIGIVSLLILGSGIIGMQLLAGMKTPPREQAIEEQSIPVEVIVAQPENITTTISGFGEVQAIRTVPISPEISGKVVELHSELEVGARIQQHQMLLRIDTREHSLTLNTTRERLRVLKRNRDLAQQDFLRIQQLYQVHHSATLVEMENAEQAYNAMDDQVQQLEYALASSLLTIEKSTLLAPFSGRVKQVAVENDQYVLAGNPVVTLVDDSQLEIHVAVDSEQAKKLLRFEKTDAEGGANWFSQVVRVPSRITWSQGETAVSASGYLHRIVDFNPKTRTIKLAVRLDAGQKTEQSQTSFPIVAGMFCRVSIPGETLERVFRLPRQAVSFDNTVHLVVDGRLKSVTVSLASADDRFALVSGGLNPRDHVIVSPLADPLENSLVRSSETTLLALQTGGEQR